MPTTKKAATKKAAGSVVDNGSESGDEYEDWSDAEYILFGPDRKLVPVEPNLIRLYGETLDGKFPELAENKNAVMFLMVRVPEFQVIENFFVQFAFTMDQWKQVFRRMIEANFVSTPAEVYDRAYELYMTGDFKGRGWLHRICLKSDELYHLMDSEDRAAQRKRVKAGIDERLHPEKRRKRPSYAAKASSNKESVRAKKIKKAANGDPRPLEGQRIATRGHKSKNGKSKS
jgi:hypothetical protein